MIISRRAFGVAQSSRIAQRYLCQASAGTNLPSNLKLAPEPTPKRDPERFQAVDLTAANSMIRDVDVLGSPDETAGQITLDSSIWANEPRIDILHKVVLWQRAKKRQGSYSGKTRGEVSGGGKKPMRQKGSGRARQGTTRAPHHRGGGKAFPPKKRDYEFKLNAKVRKMGLKSALAAKLKEGKLVVVDDLGQDSLKTGSLKEKLTFHDWESATFIDGEIDPNFLIAVQNIPKFDVLPPIGANVYDILKKEMLVVSKQGLEGLEARLQDK